MEFGFGAKWVELLKEIAPRVTRVLHRDLIIALAARLRLPAVYIERFFVTAGGLISYGPDFVDQFRRAAGYVDRILKGEKPADLLALSVTLWG
jgi:putative ABC transport system substrate-binding protein